MLLFLGFIAPSTRIRSFPRLLPHSSRFRTTIAPKFGRNLQMDQQNSYLISERKSALFRLCDVSGYKTDLLEIHAEKPTFHIFFVPGNPGVISFYTDFLEALYESLGGAASISGKKWNWQHGRLFSLDEQIDHKVDFINDELKNIEVPIVLVAHSVGCYISVELLRRFPEKVIYFVGLYPFLAVDKESSKQSTIRKIAASPFLSTTVSSIVALLGFLPIQATRFLLKSSIGKSWSSTAIDALCNNVLQYHTMQNVLFMARTEFIKLLEEPDWAFLRKKQSQIAFLYGDDDHWGPLHMFEEMSKQVPNAVLAIEREGHTHAFSCTEAGSLWVAKYVASLIKSHIPKMNSIR